MCVPSLAVEQPRAWCSDCVCPLPDVRGVVVVALVVLAMRLQGDVVFRVRTAALDDKSEAVNILKSFADSLGAAFHPCVPAGWEGRGPLLRPHWPSHPPYVCAQIRSPVPRRPDAHPGSGG